MNILFFHRGNDHTGSTRALANLIETDFPGVQVEVVTVDEHHKGFLTGLKNVRIRKVSYPLFRGKRVKGLSYLISNIHMFWIALVRGFKFDTFYINTINPYPAVLAGRLLGKEIIYHVHEKFIDNGAEHRILEYIFNHTRAKRIFVSKYVMDQYPATGDTAVVKYNKLPASFMKNVDIRSQPGPGKNILMISSLSVAKGVLNFVKLAKMMQEFKFKMILSASPAEIESFFGDIPANLSIIPAQSNIHPYLKETDLLLSMTMPSVCIETFGLTIIEAMVYGIPAVVPNVGGPVEIVTDGYNGFCVDVEDSKAVETAIRKIMDEKNYMLFSQHALERSKMFIS